MWIVKLTCSVFSCKDVPCRMECSNLRRNGYTTIEKEDFWLS